MPHPEIRPTKFPPEFLITGLSKEQERLFLAEKEFLEALGERFFSNDATPERQQGRLIDHLQDVCSTEIADIVRLRYGFNPQGQCFSISEIGRQQKKSENWALRRLRIGLQTLWLLHHSCFNPESDKFVPLLEQRYVLDESACQGRPQKDVFRAAQALVEVHHDRKFLKSLGEEKLLGLLTSVYDRETAELFARYYRLRPFKLSTNYGLTGNISNLSSRRTDEFRDQVQRAVNAGRVVAEYLADEECGLRAWTDGRGKRKRGYTTPAKNAVRKLAEYQRQKVIQKRLSESSLAEWQKELLGMTTAAKLSGRAKKEALKEFNKKYKASFDLQDVAKLERRVLEGKVATRQHPHWLEKKEVLERFLNSWEGQNKLGEQLELLLAGDLSPSDSILSQIRHLIEDLLNGKSLNKDHLPEELLEILKEYAQGQKTVKAIVRRRGLKGERKTGLTGIVRMIIDKGL